MHRLKNSKTIIIVTGGPGTGKSFAAKKIREELSDLEVLSYDLIKEKNWDRFGFSNQKEKEELNRFGLAEFYLCLRKALRENKTILIEYPFYQYHKPKIQELVDEYGYLAITLWLHTDIQTAYERSIRRDQEENRHPGHLVLSYIPDEYQSISDLVTDAIPAYDDFCKWMQERNYNVDIGTTIDVDVTDYSLIDYDEMVKKICMIAERNN